MVDLESKNLADHSCLELYKVVDTCYYHDEMKWCPVILQIGEERIKKAYGDCEYLLQTWNLSQTKTYEHQLKRKAHLFDTDRTS